MKQQQDAVFRRCRNIFKEQARLRQPLQSPAALPPEALFADPELLKQAAVAHALEGYDPQTAKALRTNLQSGVCYEHLTVPMGRQLFYKERKKALLRVAGFMGYLK